MSYFYVNNGAANINIKADLPYNYQPMSVSPIRALTKAPILRANAIHSDVTITAPTEAAAGTTGDHEITVIDKSNLPEGAQPVGEEVTLNEGVNWTKTWDSLPRFDAQGNPIYYYVVEKKAMTDEEGVTSTTATYMIEQDENTGAFTVKITNKSTTELPKTGTIVVEKKLEGLTKDDQGFQFYLQRTSTGKYLTAGNAWSDSKALLTIYPGQKYTFTNLPLGNYVLREETGDAAITGYVLDEENSVTGTAGTGISVIADGTSEFTFENVYNPAPIRVTKAWENADGTTTAPEGATVTFELYKKSGFTETAVDDSIITLDGTADENGETAPWTAEWTGMDRSNTYIVKEVHTGDYSWQHYKATYDGDDGITYTDDPSSEGDNTITNKEETTSISVTKQWEDETGEPVTTKEAIDFTLYQTYTDGSGQQYSSVYTSATKRIGSGGESSTLTDGRGQVRYESGTWQTVIIENLPKKVLGEDGKWHTASYYVVEDGIANVTATYLLGESGSSDPEDTATKDGETIKIDNRNDSTSLTVEKTWDDLAADTPYTIDFIVQRRATAKEEWQTIRESDDESSAVKTYRLTFNGSTYSIGNTKLLSPESYPSNTIIQLAAGYEYRAVETGYTVNGEAIKVTLTDGNYIEGSSATSDNGKTWTSNIKNQLEKITVEGKKIWKDDKNHVDPKLMLKRKAGDGDWEILTAPKADPTLYEETTEDPATSSEYTYLQPIWQTRDGARWYVYRNLPKYDPAGTAYIYEVEELPVKGFAATYGGTNATLGRDITNVPVGDLQVRKIWFAGAKEDDKAAITYRIEWSTDKTNWNPLNFDSDAKTWILATYETAAQTHILTKDDVVDGNQWTAVFTNLPRLKEVINSDVTTYQPIYYRVIEEKVGETPVEYSTGDNYNGSTLIWTVVNGAPVDLDDDSTVELTMSNNKPLISISGKKTWVTNMNGSDLPEITLELTSWTDDETAAKTWTAVTSKNAISSDDHYKYVSLPEGEDDPLADDASTPRFKWYKNGNVWIYAFTYLPKNDSEGKLLHYRVTEKMTGTNANDFAQETTPGQITERGDITNWDFVNTEKTSIKVIKQWKTDNEEAEGDPFDPDRKVKVELFRKGNGATETMGFYEIEKNQNASEGEKKWQLVIPDLPKYYRDANGDLHDYSYYVVERDTGIWHVEYSQEGKIYGDGATSTVAANQVEAKDESEPIIIENSAWTKELPSTGGPGTTWIYLLGAMLLLGCGITLLSRRRAQTRHQ